jgi:hypothetical protein
MALNPKWSNFAVNTEVDALLAQLNSGYLRMYDGTQPVDADTAIGAQVKLAELRWNGTAFAPTVAGVATANAITSDTNTVAGTATWFVALKADGTTVVFMGSVGLAGCNINLNSVSIGNGGTVAVSSFTYTQPKG